MIVGCSGISSSPALGHCGNLSFAARGQRLWLFVLTGLAAESHAVSIHALNHSENNMMNHVESSMSTRGWTMLSLACLQEVESQYFHSGTVTANCIIHLRRAIDWRLLRAAAGVGATRAGLGLRAVLLMADEPKDWGQVFVYIKGRKSRTPIVTTSWKDQWSSCILFPRFCSLHPICHVPSLSGLFGLVQESAGSALDSDDATKDRWMAGC